MERHRGRFLQKQENADVFRARCWGSVGAFDGLKGRGPMWQRLACSIAFGIGVGALGYAFGQEASTPGSLIARCKWGRVEVISGRVTLDDARLGRRTTVTSGDPSSGVRETLSFSAKSPRTACLHYEYADEEQQMFVDVERARRVTIERLPHSGSSLAAVRFRQPERGEITLTVTCKERSLEIVADSFWHLMLSDPQACRDHLIPILQSLRPDWRLQWTAERVESALLDVARRGKTPDKKRIEQLVSQLGHSEFMRRQVADRQLRDMGQAVLAYLDSLDERALNAEQRSRIRRIKMSLRINDGDTPVRVAAWLASDVPVWVSLLEREEQGTRIAAARHLASISGKSVTFDPLADQIERQRQIVRLRAAFGLDRPLLVGGGDGTTLRR